MAAAIGQEIRKSLVAKKNKDLQTMSVIDENAESMATAKNEKEQVEMVLTEANEKIEGSKSSKVGYGVVETHIVGGSSIIEDTMTEGGSSSVSATTGEDTLTEGGSSSVSSTTGDPSSTDKTPVEGSSSGMEDCTAVEGGSGSCS